MGKTGPISRTYHKTADEIRQILFKHNEAKSAKEIQKLINDPAVPKSYPPVKKALDLLTLREEVTIKEIQGLKGPIPKKVYNLTEKGRDEAERLHLIHEHTNKISDLSLSQLRLELEKSQKKLEILRIQEENARSLNNIEDPTDREIELAERLKLRAEAGDPRAKEAFRKMAEEWFRLKEKKALK